jgi:TRAP-type uncharacterized transport system substrate-binding protein
MVDRDATRGRESTATRRRPRAWLGLVLGLGTLAAGMVAAIVTRRPAVVRFTLTAGSAGTTRALISQALLDTARKRHADARLVETPNARGEIAMVDDGTVDFALVSGAYHFERADHVREVAPLYVEALQLAVKEELAGAVAENLGALRGRTIDVGPVDSETAVLAEALLAFSQIADGSPASSGLATHNLDGETLLARIAAGDRNALPDALFVLGIVPERVVQALVSAGRYRLVPLPFADAFRLNALLATTPGVDPVGVRAADRQYVIDAIVPPFTYSRDPAVPSEPLQTVGSRLLLIANDRVPNDTVAFVLDAIFKSRFSRIANPPLDPSVLALPPHLHPHPGTIAYVRRTQPLLTSENLGKLSNALSILGALVGGGLCLTQWRRQRAKTQRENLFGSYVVRVADIERRLAALELAATLDPPSLIALQQELLRVKGEALERFTAGELGDHTALTNLLGPLDAARDHIGELLLHVRDNIEERAVAEGRSEQALWAAATTAPPGTKAAS